MDKVKVTLTIEFNNVLDINIKEIAKDFKVLQVGKKNNRYIDFSFHMLEPANYDDKDSEYGFVDWTQSELLSTLLEKRGEHMSVDINFELQKSELGKNNMDKVSVNFKDYQFVIDSVQSLINQIKTKPVAPLYRANDDYKEGYKDGLVKASYQISDRLEYLNTMLMRKLKTPEI